MQSFQTKVIEKESDFLGKQPKQQMKFVIMDSQLPTNQRFSCKSCGQQKQSNAQIMDYQELKQNLDKQQKDMIQYYEPIIGPHIQFVESFQNIIDSLKTRLIQQLDYLLLLSKDWITNIIDSVNQQSVFGELDELIVGQVSFIDPTNIIESIKKIHKDCNLKINPNLDQFKLQPEFERCQEIFEQLLTQSRLPSNLFSSCILILLHLQLNSVDLFKFIPFMLTLLNCDSLKLH